MADKDNSSGCSNKMIFRLKNPVKNFQWGCRHSLTELFGIPNPIAEPQAELWMGAHSSGSSYIDIGGKELPLGEAIENDPSYWLGANADKFSGKLPFLVKILAADQPLSIQVHPSKSAAKRGYEKENKLGIALNASERNYKDANHKPEMVYALTPYLAMNGFRELELISKLFSVVEFSSIKSIVNLFIASPNIDSLQHLFTAILQLDPIEKQRAVSELLSFELTEEHDHNVVEAFKLIHDLAKIYPNDVGLFSPLFLNVIELLPGEAMFLYAETPHAYLKGVGVEVMANSDNVLRAGLTPKYIDALELVANTKFEPIKLCNIKIFPQKNGRRETYPIPVDDFKFDVINSGSVNLTVCSPEIVLCIEGQSKIYYQGRSWVLKKGDSVVIPVEAKSYTLDCQGTVTRTYC